MMAAFIAFVFIFCALFAKWVAPYNPFDAASLELMDSLLPPAWSADGSTKYLLGTDDQGRDILSALMYGTRISLVVGMASVMLSLLVGVSLGLIAGFRGGWLDAFIMRLCDVMLSFPAILVALLIAGVGRAVFPDADDSMAFGVLIISISLTGWVQYARTVRGSVMVEKNKDYVAAALPAELLELVYLRISLINGCAYCIDMHTRDLLKQGVKIDKVALVPVWDEAAPLFSDKEQAALAWAETVTRVAQTAIPDQDYQAARAVFNEKQLVDLTIGLRVTEEVEREGLDLGEHGERAYNY